MKTILRSIIFYTISLYLVSELFSGLRITGGIQTIFLGGLILAGMSLILKPILQIVSFPINLISLGLFSFIINAGLLYLMTRFVPHISVHAFVLHKFAYKNVSTPQLALNIYLSFIFLSFMVSFFTTILTWITRGE